MFFDIVSLVLRVYVIENRYYRNQEFLKLLVSEISWLSLVSERMCIDRFLFRIFNGILFYEKGKTNKSKVSS